MPKQQPQIRYELSQISSKTIPAIMAAIVKSVELGELTEQRARIYIDASHVALAAEREAKAR